MTVIDNDVYSRKPATWRDPTQPLSFLDAITPARFAYLRGALHRLGVDPAGKATLDIGCGGGLLAEEFARLGCSVMGVDPSEPSLRYARRHAGEAGLDIDYRQGTGEALPVAAGSFDIAYCCDVLEHVADLDRVIAETARVLRPGSTFLYDTINRTFLSKIVMIKATQEWRLTRLFDFPLHDWSMFIKPAELYAALSRHHFENQEMMGFGPTAGPLAMASAFWRFKRGRAGYHDLGRSMAAGPIAAMSVSYIGYAVKRG